MLLLSLFTPLAITLSPAQVDRAPKSSSAARTTTSQSGEKPEAAGISIGADALDFNRETPAPHPTMCWVAPKRLQRRYQEPLRAAFENAALSSRPAHVHYPVVQISSKPGDVALHECLAITKVDVRKLARRSQIMLSTQEAGAPAAAVEGSLTVTLAKLDASDFKPEWEKIWAFFSPPVPPAPPAAIAETKEPSTFVDEDLEREQAALSTAQQAAPRGPIAAVLLDLGFFSRALSARAPGLAQDRASAFSAGFEVALLGQGLLRLPPEHDLELSAGYRKRFLEATRGDTELDLSADRINITAAYRYHLGDADYLPRIGGLVGYERLRIDLDGNAEALSTRYGVLRVGLSVEEQVLSDDSLRIVLGLEPALRLTPGTDGGRSSPSFDVGGGATLELPVGFLARAWVRYARHSATTFGTEFSDGYLDAEIGLGWSL
ncbi:MAG: hypothetical protein IPK13_16745 [Deltaproteobacteria bacterium]|nr:hypothetical protein [Deltaproteobacteria bacterium]